MHTTNLRKVGGCHRDLRTMRGYVRRAGLVTESPAGMLDL
jgi:hypothetical protein